MKLLWTGTDVLMLKNRHLRKLSKRPYWIAFKVVVKFLDRFIIDGHVTNSELLKKELKDIGFKKEIEIMLTPLKHIEKYKKIKHSSFNVLYYRPTMSDKKFRDWLYGIDLIERLKKDCSASFIPIDGTADMKDIYPIIDMYIRPNRHDGNSRIIRECIIQEIPYYWSDQNPNYEEMKKRLNDEIMKL